MARTASHAWHIPVLCSGVLLCGFYMFPLSLHLCLSISQIHIHLSLGCLPSSSLLPNCLQLCFHSLFTCSLQSVCKIPDVDSWNQTRVLYKNQQALLATESSHEPSQLSFRRSMYEPQHSLPICLCCMPPTITKSEMFMKHLRKFFCSVTFSRGVRLKKMFVCPRQAGRARHQTSPTW